MRSLLSLSLAVLGLSVLVALTAPAQAYRTQHTRAHELLSKNYNFEQYVAEYNKVYASAEETTMRRAIFEANLQRVLQHNARPGVTWKMGINHMSDYTNSEMEALRGYRRALSYQPHVVRKRALMAKPYAAVRSPHTVLPTEVDWREKGAVTPVKDQGGCGSCWSFASAETIESLYYLKTGVLVELSEQQILSCTSNPKQCGGTGGCGGGTAEVAFQSIIDDGGISDEWTYPYISYAGQDYPCRINSSTSGFAPVVQLSSYVQLPLNDQDALMHAVATVGPIAISVDARAWGAYESGVFSGCDMNKPEVDHLVELVGYGTDKDGGDYWLVRNSWSASWGDHGYIKIARTATPQCGVDTNPGAGSACQPYPANVTVCGQCGILSDSAYPILA